MQIHHRNEVWKVGLFIFCVSKLRTCKSHINHTQRQLFLLHSVRESNFAKDTVGPGKECSVDYLGLWAAEIFAELDKAYNWHSVLVDSFITNHVRCNPKTPFFFQVKRLPCDDLRLLEEWEDKRKCSVGSDQGFSYHFTYLIRYTQVNHVENIERVQLFINVFVAL